MSRDLLPAFIQASANGAAVRKGQGNELRKVSGPVSLLFVVITGLFGSLGGGDEFELGNC